MFSGPTWLQANSSIRSFVHACIHYLPHEDDEEQVLELDVRGHSQVAAPGEADLQVGQVGEHDLGRREELQSQDDEADKGGTLAHGHAAEDRVLEAVRVRVRVGAGAGQNGEG